MDFVVAWLGDGVDENNIFITLENFTIVCTIHPTGWAANIFRNV